MAETEEWLENLRSPKWDVAAQAANALQDVPGERITRALAQALDAYDTAITDAAAESLIARDDWLAVDLMWAALTTHSDDVTDQMWSVIDSYPEHRITRELNRRYETQPPRTD
jgi:hypothetical protein